MSAEYDASQIGKLEGVPPSRVDRLLAKPVGEWGKGDLLDAIYLVDDLTTPNRVELRAKLQAALAAH